MLTWSAYYTDGSSLQQYEGDVEHRFGDIDQTRLRSFRVSDEKNEILVDLFNGLMRINNKLVETPHSNIEEDYRLIYFRRVLQTMGTRPGLQSRRSVCYVGYQVTIDGKNFKYFIGLDDNGILFLSDK
jgi:hypothetical protein